MGARPILADKNVSAPELIELLGEIQLLKNYCANFTVDMVLCFFVRLLTDFTLYANGEEKKLKGLTGEEERAELAMASLRKLKMYLAQQVGASHYHKIHGMPEGPKS